MRSLSSVKRSPFFEREELEVHLLLPQLAPLVVAEDPPALQQIAQRAQTRLVDQDALFLLAQRRHELAHGLGGALDGLLQDGDALQQVIVERKAGFADFLFEPGFLGAGRAREYEELLVAASTVLFGFPILRAAGLTVHSRLGRKRRAGSGSARE